MRAAPCRAGAARCAIVKFVNRLSGLIHSMTLLHEWRPVLVCLIALAWTCSAGVPAFAREAALVDHSDQDSAKADDKADKADKADSGTPKAKSKKKKKKAAAKDAATAGVSNDSEDASDGETASAAQNPEKPGKTPKHPELKIGKDITLEFHARIEGDLRGATPDIGRENAALEWQDRRF